MPNVLVHLHLDKSRCNHELSPEQQRALSDIVKKTNAAHLEKDRRFRKEMSEVDDLIDPRIPIIVFGGPPGTGKTYGVKVIAAKSVTLIRFCNQNA